MNNHKFCFIICTNNDLLLEEALHYISHLYLPEGYETDLITINEASSMTTAYNEALSATDAKFKIYMHQDVFILNKYILTDLLKIFQSDTQIGMIGMAGYDTVSPDGIMWNMKRIGSPYQRKPESPYPQLSQYSYSLDKDGYSLAAQIDGFFIATAFDLPWNTDLLQGFDFYDAFQCISFLKHGYKIAALFKIIPGACTMTEQSLIFANITITAICSCKTAKIVWESIIQKYWHQDNQTRTLSLITAE